MKDEFDGSTSGLTSPARRLLAVTPADADLAGGLTRGLFVGRAGTIAVRDSYGTTVTFTSADSQYHPIRVIRVLAAGTTATGIVALY